MSIWFNENLSQPDLPDLTTGTMSSTLGMEWVAFGNDYLEIRMPVDQRTLQPYGLLHGGASCALAETIGSIGSHLVTDPEKFLSVGLEINANHISSVRSGWVTGRAVPIHLGKSTHVWDIRITSEDGKLVCISRLTVAIIPKK